MNTKHYFLSALLLVGVFFLFDIIAQELTLGCDHEYLQTLQWIGDTSLPLGPYMDLQHAISDIHAECSGMMFDSYTYGLHAFIGPVQLKAGTWITTAVTDGALVVDTTLIEGECDLSFGNISNIVPWTASKGLRQSIASESCTFLIEIKSSGDPWILVFEKLS